MTTAAFERFSEADLERSIPERFARQVARHAGRLAVQCGEHRLSYGELACASDRFAARLLEERPPGAEPIALLLGQSVAMVVAILGVLKAGKLYVPLDPAAPAAELDRQLDHSQAKLLVAEAATAAIATHHATAERLVLVCDLEADDELAHVEVEIGPDDHAYIFYTSGTTGAAKGVVDSHRNVLHNVMRYTNTLRIGPDDRLTLLQAPHFSGAVSSLFGALLNGAAVFPLDLQRQSIGQIARAIAEHEITIYHSVPAIFEQVARTGLRFPALRLIRLEGDQATRRHVELFKQAFGRSCTLVNGLGATETGLTRQLFVDHDTTIEGHALPLGYATPDMETRILDEAGREVTNDEIGEVAIESRYLAVGYWRDPARTAAAFTPVGDGRRRYRTGDLGRLRADGCLEYLGRRDLRTKLHGRWLDVDAIEAALQALDGVDDAVVEAREVGGGSVQLVAYVVPAEGVAPTPGSLRRSLAERLPAEAIPARFVVLAALPLNANFKVDRAALPPPDPARPALDTPFAAPRDPIELELAAIWCEVLGLERVGIHDPFFELGGDSLAALRVVHLIEERIEAGLPVSALLEAATIALMAERLRATRQADAVVTIRPGGAGATLFCIHDQSGEVLCYRELALHLSCDDRPILGLRAAGFRGDVVVPVEQMAAGYLQAIRRAQPHGPYLLVGNCFGGVIAYEIAQQLVRAGEPVGLLLLVDTAFPSGAVRERLGRMRRWWWRLADLPARIWLEQVGGRLLARLTRRIGAQRRDQHAVGSPNDAIARALRTAGHRYRPQPYGGEALLVRIGEATNQGGWERLIDRLEVVELPLRSRRIDADAVRPPYVDRLSALLAQRLPVA